MKTKAILAGFAVALIAVGAGLWWVNGARTYTALESGSWAWAGDDGRWADNDEPGHPRRVVKPLREGKITQFGFTVRNGGDRLVEITGVGPEPSAEVRDVTLTPAGVKVGPDATVPTRDLEPFHRVQLEPHQERYFVLALRMPACTSLGPGSSLNIRTVEVRYRSLVFDRAQDVELEQPIDIRHGRHCS